MLILTRRVGEKINIGDDVEVLVGLIKGDQVKLCITAPKEVSVHRHEVFLAVKSGKTKADRFKERMMMRRRAREDKVTIKQMPTPVVIIKKGKLGGV